MIKEQKKWMYYTYFHRKPCFRWRTAYLFSPVKKRIAGMTCVPVPTMITDIRECDFIESWSKSTKYKVSKAKEEELSIRRGKDVLPDILHLFDQTARFRKLRGHLPEDFDSRPWILCSAIYAGELMLAGHVWVLDEEEKRSLLFVNASGHHAPDKDPSFVGRAHYYLLWQDGMHLRNHGIDFLDLNGYDTQAKDPALAGVYSWKEGTHGQQEELFNYYPFWLHWLRALRKKLSR